MEISDVGFSQIILLVFISDPLIFKTIGLGFAKRLISFAG